jgi:protease I
MIKKVAILATSGFEESELKSPKEYLEKEGFTAHIVSLKKGSIKSWNLKDWGKDYPVDFTLNEVTSKDYDALVLPGCAINPDKLRTEENAMTFVKGFFNEKKPVAAFAEGTHILINAEVVKGRQVTSDLSTKRDLVNAGAIWKDQEVVVDKGLVTGQTIKDLPTFNKRMVEEIKGKMYS